MMGMILTIILACFQVLYVEPTLDLLIAIIDQHPSNKNKTINFVMFVATLLLIAAIFILIGVVDHRAIEDQLYFIKDVLLTFACISLIKLLTIKLTKKKACLHD